VKLRLVVALLVIVACRKPRWGDKLATELHVAGFTIKIPEGWRSLSESAGHLEAKLAADTVGMMPEANRDGILTATVLVTARPLSEVSWTSCTTAVETARSNYSLPISDVHDTGTACTWHASMGRLIATIGLRKVGDTEVTLQCLVEASGDRAADGVCEQVLDTLQMR